MESRSNYLKEQAVLIKTKSLYFHFVILTVIFCSFSLNASAVNLCIPKGYTVGFFNGVWNTPRQAAQGLNALKSLMGTTYNTEPVQYEVFYNHSGSTVAATGLQDVSETFIQRAAEIDASGELGRRFEFFWESVSGKTTYWDRLMGVFPNAISVFDQLKIDIRAKFVASVANFFSNPPTAADYADHNTRLDALAVEKQKLMLIAHSQGNLFMNHAYDHILPALGVTGVQAAHIAPASSTLRGGYLLADIDLVINGLRAQGAGTVPAINLTLPISTSDLSGHTLIGTYLDPNRSGRAAVQLMVNNAMQQLVAPVTTGNTGAFTVTLTWDGAGDVDLHTFEPNGAHVFYQAKAGVVGFLDTDNTVSFGPEHYFASCDSTVLQTGIYSVGINNFSGATGRIATVQVATSLGGVINTRSLSVGPALGSGGNPSPIHVFNVVVSTDPINGRILYTVN